MFRKIGELTEPSQNNSQTAVFSFLQFGIVYNNGKLSGTVWFVVLAVQNSVITKSAEKFSIYILYIYDIFAT